MPPAPTQLLLLVRVLTQEGIKRKVGKGNGMQRLAVQLWSQTHEGPNAASALLGCVALGWRHPCSASATVSVIGPLSFLCRPEE